MIYDIFIVESVKWLFYGSIHVFSVCMFQINFLSDNKRGKLETKLSFYTHYSAHGNLITLFIFNIEHFFIILIIIILPSQISTILFSNINSSIMASNLIEIQRMDPLRIATWRIFRENIFYIFEKLNVFVKDCSLSLSSS